MNLQSIDDPQRDQPRLPKGYRNPRKETGLLPWSHTRQHLEEAYVYWIGSVRPDGRPHVMPVWGVWMDNIFYFDGSPETRRGRNLAANPNTTMHLDSDGQGHEVVIVEGQTQMLVQPERALTERLAAAYAAKYAGEGYSPTPDQWDSGGLYALTPSKVFAWTIFFQDATRWKFS
jgi:PPOX class probable F420-dependent enzyme